MKYLLIVIGALLFFSSCSTLNKANKVMDKLKEKNPYDYYSLLSSRSPKDTVFLSFDIKDDSLINTLLKQNDSLLTLFKLQKEPMEDYDSVAAKRVFDSLNSISFEQGFFRISPEHCIDVQNFKLLKQQKKQLTEQLQKSSDMIKLLQDKLKKPIIINKTEEKKLESKIVNLNKTIEKQYKKISTLKGVLYGLGGILLLFLVLFFFLIKSKTKPHV